jgi:predicted MFS family arabinose efflux permease
VNSEAPDESASAPKSSSIWQERDYLWYSLGNAFSFMGTWAQRIGVGWLSWDLTNSATWVGCISLAQYLPLIVLGPLFGVLLDRHDRRAYAFFVNASSTVVAVMLYGLTALGWMTIQLLLMLAILAGVVNSAYQTSRLAMVNDLVAPQHLVQAIAVNSVLFNLSRALGPAAAGLLIAREGIASAFAANAASFVLVLVALSIIELRPVSPKSAPKDLLSETREGWAYIWARPRLRQLLTLSAITAVLGRGFLELLPAFSAEVFNRGSAGLAQLYTAVGVGAIVGAVLLSRSGRGGRLGRLTRYATLGLGLVLAMFGISHTYVVGLSVMVLFGLVVVLCSVGLQTILQSTLEDRYRGRVLGLWSSVNVAGPGVGAAILGAFSRIAGLMTLTVVSGLLCAILALGVIGRRRFPLD